ncbi:MAG: acetyl-CoA carboxylase biotin carboxyl carrier protein subunit [Pseudomonadales bacterium]
MSRISVESEVAGNVWKIHVSEGEQVSPGQELMILESMKMEIPVESPAAGKILQLRVAPEDAVEEEQVLVVLESG